ncbi:MAG: hypothetical protein IH624_05925 [Phycisphaerae bacterium]|nr:hypothetical protein [Phycisphaerae bacterium]
MKTMKNMKKKIFKLLSGLFTGMHRMNKVYKEIVIATMKHLKNIKKKGRKIFAGSNKSRMVHK